MRSTENRINMSKLLQKKSEKSQEIIVTEGKWGDVPWQFVAKTQEPKADLCTAAFCIVTHRGKLVLVEHQSRGHEFTGGHVDPGEEITTTIIREVREESLSVIDKPKFFGYKKVSPPEPISHRDDPTSFYPFPHSYIPYYVAEASQLMDNEVLTDDIKLVRLATYQEALALLNPDHNHDKILDYLISNRLINI